MKNIYILAQACRHKLCQKQRTKIPATYLFLICSIALFLTGCGYNMGTIANPQIKTIAISPIKNKTYMPNLSTFMRQALSEAFQTDGSYKVKNVYNADCVLYGRVLSVEINPIDVQSSKEGSTFITQEFSMRMKFEFTVVIPGQVEPLIATTQVIGVTEYQLLTDQLVAQQNAAKEAAWDAAKQVMWNCTESW